MKKSLIYIFVILGLGILIGFYLILFTRGNKNGFNRNFIETDLKFTNKLDLGSNRFSFAGASDDDSIYLLHLDSPEVLYTVNPNINKMKRSVLSEVPLFNPKKGYSIICRSDTNILMANGKTGSLAVKATETGTIKKYKVPISYFDQPLLLSRNSIIIRGITVESNTGRELIKVKLAQDAVIEKKLLLKKQIDGFFCTDGWMQYDIKKSRIFYIYYYRGSYMCLDTNLNILKTNKTIDTVMLAQINSIKLSGQDSKGNKTQTTTQAKPPMVVNRKSTIYGDYLYINSSLKADNESYSDFRNNNVIDIYSSLTGKYIYSFYIPRYEARKLTDFQVSGNTIYTVSGNYLIQMKAKKLFPFDK